MKHKHAELIHAWADGAQIQIKDKQTGWEDLCSTPSWRNDFEYRIKPEEKKPVVRWMWAWEEHKLWCMSDTFMTEEEAKELETESGIRYIKLDWSRTEFPE
jgi:hypothetical protein